MWCDPVSGRRVAVWVFAMILSCSRALFVQPVLRMDQTSWNASHVAAFEFFGGVPASVGPRLCGAPHNRTSVPDRVMCPTARKPCWGGGDRSSSGT